MYRETHFFNLRMQWEISCIFNNRNNFFRETRTHMWVKPIIAITITRQTRNLNK